MKLQAQSSRALCSALQKSAKCIGGKSTLAILDHVLLSRRDDGKYMFTSATGEAQLTVPAPFMDVDGQFGQSVALPIGLLVPFLSTLPDCVVTFNFVDEKTLRLEYCTNGSGDKVKSGKAQFAYLSGEEFPIKQRPADRATHIVMPYKTFDSLLNQTSPFIITNELRLVMSTLLIDVAEDRSEVTFVGTTGNILYKSTYSNNPQKGGGDFFRGGEARQIKVLNTFFRILSAFDGVETIDIESDDRTVRFSSGDIELLCSEIEARYPSYNSVIPKGNPFFVTFNKNEMLTIIKRVILFASESSHLITVQKQGMFLEISAEDKDFSQGAHDQVVIIDLHCEDGFKIGFNASHLQTAVNAIQGDTVRMQLSEANRAAVLTADEPSPTALALCMPTLIEEQ